MCSPKEVDIHLSNPVRRDFAQGKLKASEHLPNLFLIVPSVCLTNLENWGTGHNKNTLQEVKHSR